MTWFSRWRDKRRLRKLTHDMANADQLPFTSAEVALETMLRDMRSGKSEGGVMKLAGGQGEELLRRLFQELPEGARVVPVVFPEGLCDDPTHNHPWNNHDD